MDRQSLQFGKPAGGLLSLSWFILSIYTQGGTRRNYPKYKITYCICIVREQTNRHLCTGISSRTASSVFNSWATILILWSRESQISLRKKLRKPANLLFHSPKDMHTELAVYTYVLGNLYPLTTWLLLPKFTSLYSNNCTVDQKTLIPLFSWSLGKMPEKVIEV